MAAAPLVAPTPIVMRTTGWADYALLDCGDGRKLERYGRYSVVRPEPQCFWKPRLAPERWDQADAVFDPAGDEDEGRWKFSRKAEERFALQWEQVRFWGRFTPFRHLAFFPEQQANWAYIDQSVRAMSEPRVLNLFGYTGVASLAAAAAGAAVTHVDASKKSVGWARENAELSGLSDRPVRWIVEDARRYLQREARRGSQYEGVILDPPKYGRGPTGEVWRLFEDMADTLRTCAEVLSPSARFLIVNAYAARVSGLALASAMAEALHDRGGRIEWGELALVEEGQGRSIGLSFFARWSAEP